MLYRHIDQDARLIEAGGLAYVTRQRLPLEGDLKNRSVQILPYLEVCTAFPTSHTSHTKGIKPPGLVSRISILHPGLKYCPNKSAFAVRGQE